MSWKIRPDCTVPGCTNEVANKGSLFCRNCDPRRCKAVVGSSDRDDSRCRSRAADGYDLCKRHLKLRGE